MKEKRSAAKEPAPRSAPEVASSPPSEAQGGGAPPRVPPATGIQYKDLSWIFEHHKPTEDQVDKYNQISTAAKALAQVILDTCPACADRTDAIRKVREARMTANASIALHGEV